MQNNKYKQQKAEYYHHKSGIKMPQMVEKYFYVQGNTR